MRLSGIIILAGLSLVDTRVAVEPELAYSAFSSDGARHFDFWIGEWEVNLRTLQDDLTFRDWARAKASVYSILGGKGILELWDSKPIKGFSLRYYDSTSKQWEVWIDWPEPNHSHLSSLEGGFRHGRGEFVDVSPGADGQVITSVHSFSDVTPFSLRWEDRYSADNGKTWARHREMEFTRSAVEPKWPLSRKSVPTYVDGGLCDEEHFRFESLIGMWRGDAGSFIVLPVLDGCALIGFLDAVDGADEFVFHTFDSVEKQWVTAVLDDIPDTGLVRYLGEEWGDFNADGVGSVHWAVSRSGPGGIGTPGDVLVYQRGERVIKLTRVS